MIDAYPKATGGRIGYFEDWLTHPDAADSYWTSPDAAAGAPAPAVPVSLLTGWQDICLDQNLAEYQRLRAAGRTPRLVIGPWSHTSGFNDDLPIVVGEALDWLTAYCSKTPAGSARPPVRVHVGGGRGEWRDLPDWPPPGSAEQVWRLTAAGQLSAGRPALPGVSSFRYDPADPTPSVGGQLLSNKAGPVDNKALEARADVLVFTSPPLAADLEVIGPVSARLRVRASRPYFDVFARLCDVDPRGRSRNVCDGLIRHVPAADPAGAADGRSRCRWARRLTGSGPGTGCGCRCPAARTPGSPGTPAPASRGPPRPGWPRWTWRSCTTRQTPAGCRCRCWAEP